MTKNQDSWIWIIVGVVVFIVMFGGYGMGHYGMMRFSMGFGFLFMLLFWGALIWLVVTLIHSAFNKKDRNDNALSILKNRYAKGEISKKQFEEMKKEVK
jgi:putative membrane protein